MTNLQELLLASEQATRLEILAWMSKPFFPGEVRSFPADAKDCGALERVIKAAVTKATDDAQADAIRRFRIADVNQAIELEIAKIENRAHFTANMKLAGKL